MSLFITSPGRGDAFVAGERLSVEWDGDGPADSYQVRLSVDGGDTFMMLSGPLPGSARSFQFTVPNAPGDSVILRVLAKNAAGKTLTQRDTAVLTFLRPGMSAIHVDFPESGSVLAPGEKVKIRWRTTGAVETHEVRLSTDSGATFVIVSSLLPASARELEWTVPNAPTSDDIIRVVGRDAAGKIVAKGNSHGAFAIRERHVDTAVEVLRPVGGERFRPGERVKIEWDTRGPVSAHELRFSVDGGVAYLKILDELDLPGTARSFVFTVPDTATDDARLRVIARGTTGALLAVGNSAAPFAIGAAPSLAANATEPRRPVAAPESQTPAAPVSGPGKKQPSTLIGVGEFPRRGK